MAYTEAQITHGGIAYFAQVVRGMLAGGWTLLKASYNHPGWASEPVAQSNTIPTSIDMTGAVLPSQVQLPVMFLPSAQEVKKDFTTVLTEGVDYTLDEDTGDLEVLAGGAMDNGAGFWDGAITLDAGYEIRRGWVLLQSNGISGTETLIVGLRFVNDSGVASNPFMTGIEVSSWVTTLPDGSNYDDVVMNRRSAVEHNTYSMIPANADVLVSWSLTKQRIICRGRANCFSSWFAAGGLYRMRPSTEQSLVSAHIGGTPRLEDRAGGPVGKTNEPGDLSRLDSRCMGSVWAYDVSRFPGPEEFPIEMNANYWSNEVGHPGDGYTSSRRVVVAGSGSTPDVVYFEVHNVIVAQNAHLPLDAASVIYGLWEGLYTVLCYEATDNLQVTMDGRVFRLWSVGDSLTRFIAVEEI